ncbi:YdcF family protein [Paenibacillus aestuarii]|uniref:YdcF family protein n=1 Tax=Paenibacillus aestuarii TaxID=516965 RepID=A0ABW0K0Y1_9BACL|nr:YdcF family protein [Paenibacillus aestuarii]
MPRYKRMIRTMFGIIILCLIITLILYMTRYSWLHVLGNKLVVADVANKSDVIIVLGGEGGFAERSKKAAELYANGYAPTVLLTDGTFNYEHEKEINKMMSRLHALGVPESAMMLEDRAQSTFDNAKYTKQILLERGMKRALVITSDWHTMRAKLTFDKVYQRSGIQLSYIAGKSQYPLDDWWHYHDTRENVPLEWVKIVGYKLLNRA